MVELVTTPLHQKPVARPKMPIDVLVGKVIEYLKGHPQGETVEDLAGNLEISIPNIKKILGIITVVTSELAPLFLHNQGGNVRLLLTRSTKGSVTAARFEVTPREPSKEGEESPSSMNQKPTYTVDPADIAEIQRVWKLYKATGRAFQCEEATRLDSLCQKFPCLFTTNATKTGILPTMALFTVARTLEQYTALGRLPDAIETRVAVIKFERG